MTPLKSLSLITLAAGTLCSCSSPDLKAPPAPLSAFLGPTPSLKADPEKSPFALSGGSAVTQRKGIYIAPVTLKYLRDGSKTLANAEGNEESRQRAARKLAEYAQEKFTEAFAKSAQPRYVVTDKPGPDNLTLELAFTELNRNTFTGAFAKFAIATVAVPGTDAIFTKATRPLKGNIAIEGKLISNASKKVIYQFEDNEESKSAFLLPITDFTIYGQARQAIRAWAKQFEEVTRAAPDEPVKDSSVISLF